MAPSLILMSGKAVSKELRLAQGGRTKHLVGVGTLDRISLWSDMTLELRRQQLGAVGYLEDQANACGIVR